MDPEREFERCRPRLMAMLRRWGADLQDSEDIVQETFMTALRIIDTYEDKGALFNWLCRIAINKVMNRRRKKRIMTVPLPEGFDPIAEPDDVDSETIDSEIQVAVQDCIGKLQDLEQTVIRLKSAGYRSKEIGSITGWTPRNVDTRYHRIVDKVKKCLQVKNIYLEDSK